MICDKAVMSRPQVDPPPPHFAHVSSTCVENGSPVSGSQRTFISHHLCGLRRDDLGLEPSQPSCHLRKKKEREGAARRKEEKGGEEGSQIVFYLDV